MKRAVAFLALLLAACATEPPPPEERTWLRLENRAFVIYSLAPAEETRRIAEHLERFRTASAPVLAPRRPAGSKLRVLVADEQGLFFERGCDAEKQLAKRCGFASEPGSDGLLLRSGHPDSLTRQLIGYGYARAVLAYSPLSLPAWYVEGVALLLSTLEQEGREVVFGTPPLGFAAFLAAMRDDDVPAPSTGQILAEGFSTSDTQLDVLVRYWALAHHWLVDGADGDALNSYLAARTPGGDRSPAAFVRAFGVDPDVYWAREVWPRLADGTVTVKRFTVRGPAPDLVFDERPAPGTEAMGPGRTAD